MNDLTPYPRIDLDAVARNIERFQSYCDAHRLAFRPHVKTHKLPAIAHMQIRAGAVGITCQKLGEAELMVAAGIEDVLISFPLVGAANVARLAALARHARVTVALDSVAVAVGLSAGLADAGEEVGVLVEVDAGLGRTGVRRAEDAAEIASRVAALPGLRFVGLMTYPTPDDPALVVAAIAAIAAVGLTVEQISAGGTPSAFSTHELPGVTEMRAGTYVLGDRACVAHDIMPVSDCALEVRATVVSRPEPGVAVIDAGTKALTGDPVEADGVGGLGLVLERPNAHVALLYEEHGRVELDPSEPDLEIGDVISIVPNHACTVMNLHDVVAVHRSGRPVGTWPVAARGASR